MVKKSLISLLFLLIFVVGWKAEMHESAVEAAYYSMPDDLRNELSLDRMKEGSVAPDKNFKDFRCHRYPCSYNKTLMWLGLAKQNYERNHFENASFSFGVATHYILDSIDAAHYVSNETGKMHDDFESAGVGFYIGCREHGKSLMGMDYRNSGAEEWERWIISGENVQEKELKEGMKLVYLAGVETFRFECKEGITFFNKKNLFSGNLIAMLVFFFIFVLIAKFF